MATQRHHDSISIEFGKKIELIAEMLESVAMSWVGHVLSSVWGQSQCGLKRTTTTLDMYSEHMLKRQCLTVLLFYP